MGKAVHRPLNMGKLGLEAGMSVAAEKGGQVTDGTRPRSLGLHPSGPDPVHEGMEKGNGKGNGKGVRNL